MFKLILLSFGLRSDQSYHFLNSCLSVVTVVIHSAFFLQIPFTLFMSHSQPMIVIKVSTTVFIVAIVSSYHLIKRRSKKINKLFDELNDCQIETNSKDITETLRFAFSFAVTVFVAAFAIEWSFSDPVVDSVYDIRTLAIEFRHVFAVTAFHLSGWTFSVQIIYFELYFKYYLIIQQFNAYLESHAMTKKRVIRAQESLNRFIHFQTELDNNVKVFIYFIVAIVIALNITHLLFYLVINELNINFVISSVSMIFLWSSYFALNQYLLYTKRRIPNKIVYNINQWLRSPAKDIGLSIELLLLKRISLLFESNTNQFFQCHNSDNYV